MNQPILLVNFGGPRSLEEIEPFLCELLTDRELIRQKLPSFFHNLLFRRIAKKRASRIRVDYEEIGGASPIYETTETLAQLLSARSHRPVLTFHRYLPATHEEIFQKIETLQPKELVVIPLFPQFSYTTTGSIAVLFAKRLSPKTQNALRWIKSYPAEEPFLQAHVKLIRDFCTKHQIPEEDLVLFFSAHGIPKSFVEEGDPYSFECEQTALGISSYFPKALTQLAYQSQFGPEEWTRPYTKDLCQEIRPLCQGRSHLVFIPLSFTSDHLETLFEIETLYLPLVTQQGIRAFRCPALNLESTWIDALFSLLMQKNFCTNNMLLRRGSL